MAELITLIIFLIVVGFVLFLLNRFLPMGEQIKALINYLVVFLMLAMVVLFILNLFGIYSNPIKLK